MKSEKIVLGILAHVDAGKTTLSESLLYLNGSIRKLGRVDHKDTFLDTHQQERMRGITIFSKQAELTIQDKRITLLDTPGHVDFSAEMERTLQVLDYAVLIISGADGVQGHVETLWKLLLRYQIPVFLFVNKMDQPGTDKEKLLAEIRERLSENCMDFSPLAQAPKKEAGEKQPAWEGDAAAKAERQEFYENLALCDESLMEAYLEQGTVTGEQIAALVRERKVFPCYFGSALKMQGIEAFMEGLYQYTKYREYPEEFGARIYKISRDSQGNRLTHMKLTGGSLKVRTQLAGNSQGEAWQEKVNQIRVYSGTGFAMQTEVAAGEICAVTGLTKTFAGQGLGIEEKNNQPVLEPVLTYRLILPEDCNVHALLLQLRQLEEEEPLLRIVWKEAIGELHAQLMGEVQIEVLKSMIQERFKVSVEFGAGSIVYKETLTEPVEGVGHFEPLRHYAEVHLLMEPQEVGSGLQFCTDCKEDVLDLNWQRLILTHLEEKQHKGVLTGSEITDMKITLIAGKAHLKHTEGGDFRQSTYRAVRQGLKMGKCRLLEPVYEYRLELPTEMVGRAMTDIQKMYGSFEGPTSIGELSVLTGTAPVVTMQGYQTEVLSYTGGKGSLSCSLKGYEPCHNEEEVIEAIGYDSERDLENPTGSVFCAHGAGFVVRFDEVYDYMHLEGRLAKKSWDKTLDDNEALLSEERREGKRQKTYAFGAADEKELEAIFQRTYGDVKKQRRGWTKTKVYHGKSLGESAMESGKTNTGRTSQEADARAYEAGRAGTDGRRKSDVLLQEYLLVDGYNIIFGWEDLNALAQVDIGAARNKLMDILCNYQGYKKIEVILVFDAYRVEGNPGSSQQYHNIHVVYTREAETADQYIERVTHEIGRRHRVTVATSDGLEQIIILGQGAKRMSAQGLREEIQSADAQIHQEIQQHSPRGNKNYLSEHFSEEMKQELKNIQQE